MLVRNISSFGLALVFFSGLAQAGQGRHNDRDLSHDVHSFRPRAVKNLPKKILECGDTVTSSVTLAADLLCPTVTGFALNVVGNNITVDGNGHRIIAPLASAGLFVEGSNNTIREMRINGILNGAGIMAYEAPNVHILYNDVSNNSQGIVVYADSNPLNGAKITNNVARNNLLFGIRTGYDAPGAVVSPLIRGNDLSGSGSYGVLVKATQFELDGGHSNSFRGSMGGIYLAGGDAYLHDFSFGDDQIQKIGVFADSLDNLTVSNVDVSSNVHATAAQERIGMDLYRVTHFTINGLDGSDNDVGLKFETDTGVNCAGTVIGSTFLRNVVSGVLMVSYDGTSYGLVKFLQNCYGAALRVFVEPGTTVATNSIPDDGVNACARGNGNQGHGDGGGGDCGPHH
jgi:hypothetical protein